MPLSPGLFPDLLLGSRLGPSYHTGEVGVNELQYRDGVLAVKLFRLHLSRPCREDVPDDNPGILNRNRQ